MIGWFDCSQAAGVSATAEIDVPLDGSRGHSGPIESTVSGFATP